MLDKTFDSKEVEARIYAQWEASGAFRAGADPDAEPFCIVIPPPNVTGHLHIGHALNNTLQDVLIRFERMRGKNVLWQPGMDHAGIATQLVVERALGKQGRKRADMTREDFIKEVWKWKGECGDAILNQQRRLGNSADWSRTRFTMDEGLSRAVRKVFVRLYNEKLIYRDKRLVNWDPRLETAVSDLEVEMIEIKGNLWYLKYPVDGTDEFITVATTRPETMLGDTAVAVHPENEKYRHLIGKSIRLPLVDRLIPIVADEHADPEKGTGAVKITPAHDFDDFEVGKRHDLPMISILTKDAKISDNAPEKYRGLDRFEARKVIVADFEALGLLEKIEPIVHAVPHDEKTKSVQLEPMLTEQWYLDVRPLAEKAIAAVETGETKFVPDNWANVYFNWLRHIQPWCISRQLWWGHQIPVWYGPKIVNGSQQINSKYGIDPKNFQTEVECFCAENERDALELAKKYYAENAPGRDVFVGDEQLGGYDSIAKILVGRPDSPIRIIRDPDVLDTWFSSALWPFSTLGWPDTTEELKRYYPTSVLITGFDIIFFWVARMMMMGIHFMDDVPFDRVFIHTRVLDEHGKKMSKTKGNVVDPLELIDAYGADALRFTLALAAGMNRDMRIGPSRVEVNRNFATKLWNAARFCEMNGCESTSAFSPNDLKQIVNRWIVAETAEVADKITSALEALHFSEAAGAAYHFVWDVFCDWYLEFAKPLFSGADEAAKAETRATAAWVRDQILKLLHPFMPYITEELWARTAASPRDALLIRTDWPDMSSVPASAEATAEMRWVIELIAGIRSVRSEMNVPAAAKIPLVLKDADAETEARLKRHESLILTLARLERAEAAEAIPAGSAQFVIGGAVAALPLAGVIDFAQERARLEKNLKKTGDEIARFEKKLSNPQFVAKAPEEVLEEQREKLANAQAVAKRLEEAIRRLA